MSVARALSSWFVRSGWVAVLVMGTIAASEPAPQAEPEVIRATALIDGWNGNSDRLQAAKYELDEALRRNPSSAPAHRAYARYYLASGYIVGTRYDDDALSSALASVDRAIALAPQYAAAHALRGRILTLMGRLGDAEDALDRARSIGTDDPMLALARATLLLQQGRNAEAGEACRQASEQASTQTLRAEADWCLIKYYRAIHQQERSDAVYRRIIAGEPDNAWAHGNYATYLLCTKDDPEAAVREARAALAIMEYGIGNKMLAASLYRLWAKELEQGNTAAAQRALEEGMQISGRLPAELLADSCDGGRAIIAVMRAAYLQGLALSDSPEMAITAARGLNGVRSVIVGMRVEGASREAEYTDIASLADFRSPDALVLRFTAPAVAAFTAKYGKPPDAFLRGRHVVATGHLLKDRLLDLRPGAPAGSIYEQTYMYLNELSQLIEIEAPAAASAGGATSRK